jgi:hypothetical protein
MNPLVSSFHTSVVVNTLKTTIRISNFPMLSPFPTITTTSQDSCIPRCTNSYFPAPSTLSRERKASGCELRHGRIRKERIGVSTTTREEWLGMKKRGGTWKKEMIEAKVKHGCKGLAECDQGCSRSNDSTCDDIVPIVDWTINKINSVERNSET